MSPSFKPWESLGTTEPLPRTYDPDSDEIPAAPEPEERLCDYTTERLQRGLAYAQKFLSKRKISPRTETFMIVYQETLKDTLAADTQGERAEHAAAIRIAETLIQRKGFLKGPNSPYQAELQDHLLQLRELQYYMRYGDYVKIIPTRSRIHASKTKTENWQLLSGRHYWSTIADRLEEEDKQGKQARANGRNMDDVCLATHIAVRRACSDLGVSEDLAFRSILEYATRNTQPHRDLGEIRAKGKFALLARTLWTDREDLDFTFSEFKSGDRYSKNEIDTWFDTSLDPTYPDVWQPREALGKCFIEAQQKSRMPTKEELKQANIAEDQRRRDEKTVRQKVASVAGSSAAGKKRVASTEEPRDSEMESEGRMKGKASRNRLGLLARRYKLEEELKKIEQELEVNESGPPETSP